MSKRKQTYRIRQATDHDRAAIRAVSRLAWESAYLHVYTRGEIAALFNGTIKQYGSWTRRRGEHLATLVMEADEQIIGYVGYARLQSGAGEVTNLYLHPQYQGRGLGKALWDAAIDALEQQGCHEVWVWVLAKAHAYQFYLRQGCEPREVGAYRIGDHAETALGCVLRLAPPLGRRYPPWWGAYLFSEDEPLPPLQSSTLPHFLRKYTLHESRLLGTWQQADGRALVLIGWEVLWANWKTRRIHVQDSAYLVILFPRLYQIITSDIHMPQSLIDRAESQPVNAAQRKLWAQLIVAQTIVSSESAEYILDDDLHHTSLVGMDGDTTHFFHTETVRLLCLDERGETVHIPGLQTHDDL